MTLWVGSESIGSVWKSDPSANLREAGTPRARRTFVMSGGWTHEVEYGTFLKLSA
jgi:hypothetical protein